MSRERAAILQLLCRNSSSQVQWKQCETVDTQESQCLLRSAARSPYLVMWLVSRAGLGSPVLTLPAVRALSSTTPTVDISPHRRIASWARLNYFVVHHKPPIRSCSHPDPPTLIYIVTNFTTTTLDFTRLPISSGLPIFTASFTPIPAAPDDGFGASRFTQDHIVRETWASARLFPEAVTVPY